MRLTDAEIISATGSHPAYAVVLVSATAGRQAIAVVDTNGDGRAIDLEFLYWRQGAWHGGSSTGFEPSFVGLVQRGEGLDYEWAYGRSTPFDVIHVDIAGVSVTTTANADGWWATVVPSADARARRAQRRTARHGYTA